MKKNIVHDAALRVAVGCAGFLVFWAAYHLPARMPVNPDYLRDEVKRQCGRDLLAAEIDTVKRVNGRGPLTNGDLVSLCVKNQQHDCCVVRLDDRIIRALYRR